MSFCPFCSNLLVPIISVDAEPLYAACKVCSRSDIKLEPEKTCIFVTVLNNENKSEDSEITKNAAYDPTAFKYKWVCTVCKEHVTGVVLTDATVVKVCKCYPTPPTIVDP